jgi:hypothetical protein
MVYKCYARMRGGDWGKELHIPLFPHAWGGDFGELDFFLDI